MAERTAPRRLRTTTGRRDAGREAAARANLLGLAVEEWLHITIPSGTDCAGVAIRLDVDAGTQRAAHGDVRRAAAERYLATLPAQAVWIWNDGSTESGVTAGSGDGLITLPPGE